MLPGRMAEEIPSPNVPAGWYPDPTQPGSQRYWDGNEWTDQLAPLPQQPQPSARASSSVDISPRLVLGGVGALIAVIACFLPRAESPVLLHISNNTLLANGDGIFVLIFALAGAAAAFRDSSKAKISWPLVIFGLLTLGFAVLEGTGDRQEVINGLGQHVESSIGPAIWTLGVGGVFMTLAGFLQRKPEEAVANSDDASPSGA
jgi:hypothetical protein